MSLPPPPGHPEAPLTLPPAPQWDMAERPDGHAAPPRWTTEFEGPSSAGGARSRGRTAARGLPAWVTVLVGVGCLLVGLGVGGSLGFVAGAGSSIVESLGGPSRVGDDATVAQGEVSARVHTVGSFVVEEVLVEPDAVGDFFSTAVVTYEGAGHYDGGAIEIWFLHGDERVGSVGGDLPPLASGEWARVELWGWDTFVEGVDMLEFRID